MTLALRPNVRKDKSDMLFRSIIVAVHPSGRYITEHSEVKDRRLTCACSESVY